MWCLAASDEEDAADSASEGGLVPIQKAKPHPPQLTIDHGPNDEHGSHDKPDLTDNTISAVSAAESSIGAANSPTNRRRRLTFFCAMTAVSIGGMGMASFGVLAGGKVGATLPTETFVAIGYGGVDIAVALNVAQESDPAASVLFVPNALRAAMWLAIGILQGSASGLWFVSFASKRTGAMWQLEPLLYDFVFCFIVRIGLVGVVMLRAHCDLRPNVFIWYVLHVYGFAAVSFGACSPYPLISALGNVANLLINTVGLYFLVMKIDKSVEQKHANTVYLQDWGFSRFSISISTSRASKSY